MDIKEIATITSKGDYASICVYIKQIEAINLSQLYRALKAYLSVLTLPQAEQYLNVYQAHLNDPYSWLAKAEFLSRVEAQRDFAREQTQAAVDHVDQTLWDDAAKKLNYLIDSWDSDTATACQQIVQGISMLVNEHIPLSEVQGEIIEFAQGRGVSAFVFENETEITLRLKHLLEDAWVNSVSALVKLARTVALQADLFLNRLVDITRLDGKQSFLFEANYQLCAFIKTHAQALREVLNHFPTNLATRLVKRLEKIEIEGVLQRYNDATQPVVDQPTYIVEESIQQKALSDIAQPVPAPVAVQPVVTASTTATSSVNLEQLLSSHEQLMESFMRQIALHRLQLSCFSRIKACYGKFSLFPAFRQIATKLTYCQKNLSDSVTQLAQINTNHNFALEDRKKINSISEALKNASSRVSTYLDTLNIHHEDYDVTVEIPSWQLKLHDLILYSSEDELLLIESRLQRIEILDSPYLRATLIMKLHITKLKLNDMIIANMQSWSSRIVERETVINTLRYLGINIAPHHLNKIAPNLRVVRKKINKKKDFYSSAAEYGIMAFKNIRAWLDKQVIT